MPSGGAVTRRRGIEPIETEQHNEEVETEAPGEEAEEEEVAEEEEEVANTEEETAVTCVKVVYMEPEPAAKPQEGQLMEPIYMDPKLNEWQAKGYQTTHSEASFYPPPSGLCLGSCTNAEGKNNADIQGAWMQMSPEEKAAERERNIAARQGGG